MWEITKKVLLWLLAIIVVGALLWLTSFFTDWPLEFVVGGFFGIVAGIYGSVYLYKYIRRKREELELKRRASQKEIQRMGRLDVSWKNAVARIKQSKLKESGDPIYVLPWY
ncbi:MAG: hypothetical protein OEZ47_15445, partial [Gammaproteobacteria bacterium]|nr:hypothetical protein [Gammaproteobacteria bacterium]